MLLKREPIIKNLGRKFKEGIKTSPFLQRVGEGPSCSVREKEGGGVRQKSRKGRERVSGAYT